MTMEVPRSLNIGSMGLKVLNLLKFGIKKTIQLMYKPLTKKKTLVSYNSVLKEPGKVMLPMILYDLRIKYQIQLVEIL